MSRLSQRLQSYRNSGRKALAAFVTAGDPDLTATVPAMHGLVAGGVDILELGVPFSDPEAEGPSIQRSSERALKNGITLANVLDMTREFRLRDDETPLVLMGYLNSVMKMGYDVFAERATEAGVDGLIMVNLPPEEADELAAELERNDIDLILLVAPTTTPDRAKLIGSRASGFVYYVSLKGVTGASHLDVSTVGKQVAALRDATSLPILVGFGIKDGATAKAVAAVADGAVVGSALVDTMGAMSDSLDAIPAALERQARELRDAIDSLDSR